MKKTKTIAVVTGSRAEYGVLKPLLKKIQQSKGLELSLYVTGIHLLKKYGTTVAVIRRDGFPIEQEIPMYKKEDRAGRYIGIGLGRGIEHFTESFAARRPDVVLVFGDRLEALAATLAAATLNVPIAHIHAGDKTDSGHIDESTRHAITRYSHIHFAPTKAAARRLLKMGEQSFRIRTVGALSIDAIKETPIVSKQALCSHLGLDGAREIIVCLFNPLPLESARMGAQAREIFAAIRALKKQTMIIYPNNDSGNSGIIKEIEKMRGLDRVVIVKSLPYEQYINLLKAADVLIGNSSSGIIEAPAIKLPVVNIGSRNFGREHAQNVIFVAPDKKAIQKAIAKALYDKKFKSVVKKCKNPYGNVGAARRIINILEKTEFNKKLMLKKLTC